MKQKAILIYDGECRFCLGGATFLRRFVGWKLRAMASQQAGALESHPDLTQEKTQARLYLVKGDKLYGGMEAVVQTLALRPLGKIAFLYYWPLLRPLFDEAYDWIARHRYQIFGRVVGGCNSTCRLPEKQIN